MFTVWHIMLNSSSDELSTDLHNGGFQQPVYNSIVYGSSRFGPQVWAIGCCASPSTSVNRTSALLTQIKADPVTNLHHPVLWCTVTENKSSGSLFDLMEVYLAISKDFLLLSFCPHTLVDHLGSSEMLLWGSCQHFFLIFLFCSRIFWFLDQLLQEGCLFQILWCWKGRYI